MDEFLISGAGLWQRNKTGTSHPGSAKIVCGCLHISEPWPFPLKAGVGMDALLGHFTPEFRGPDFVMYLESKIFV